MAGEALLLVVVLLIGVAGSLLLYLFVRAERDWERMDRETGEAAARRDRDERR